MLNAHRALQIKLKSVIWLTMTVICFPVLIPLAIYVRKITLRMPEAKGKRSGNSGNSRSITNKLTFIGESPVTGVGVATLEKGLVAITAEHLSKKMNCNINWQAVGKNGINISGCIDSLVAKIDKGTTDYLVICLGVNDTKDLTRISVWEKEITRLIDNIKSTSSCEIFFLGVPDMSYFPALPNPLGFLLGYRARILNLITVNHPYNGQLYQFIPSCLNFNADFLAKDGFHPSEKGCDKMGKIIAQFISVSRQQ